MNHPSFVVGRRMLPVWVLAAASVLLVACEGGESTGAPNVGKDDATAAVCTDGTEALDRRLALLGSGGEIEVLVTFEGRSGVSPQQVALLNDLGLRGLYFQRLPVAGVIATRDQVEQLRQLPGVRSVRWNAPLSWDDEVARELTSVERAKEQPELVNADGQPITGHGVAILINDSGVDATHPDLPFGSKVAENAHAATNLRGLTGSQMAPFTPLEGIPNTDAGGSHGTHVAGIAAGSGEASDGRFAGAASGATLIGYGSGAVIFILDSLGGFDYALKMLEERPELNLRIVSNSFGATGDQSTCFDPDHPTNVATKILADSNLVVVFSAGNAGSGPDSITGNFKKAPWILIAGNGQKNGLLARTSSRGSLANETYQVEIDGETFIVEDRPTVVAPGTNIIAARAMAADPFTPLDVLDDFASGEIPPDLLPFYTQKSGTSMAAPHLAGLVAMLLEANPDLGWREVKDILKTTATNMPGYDTWQVGAGFANIEAALAMALQLRGDYGAVNNLVRQGSFNARIGLGDATTQAFTIDFRPVGPTGSVEFEVGEDIALVIASAPVPGGNPCTCAVVLLDPAGNRFGSAIALPILTPRIATAAPGMPGTWTLTVRGIGAVSGVAVDPLGVTNGVSAPSSLDIKLELFAAGEPRGLDDISNHPASGFIEAAVGLRLMDGLPAGFTPDALLTRAQFAEYLTAWGVRQTRPHDGVAVFGDIPAGDRVAAAAAEAVTRSGQLVLDRSRDALPPLRAQAGAFAPDMPVTREDIGFGLVQVMGRQAQAQAHDSAAPLVAFDADGNMAEVVDAGEVDPALRGHVQEAILLGILDVEFFSEAGALRARVRPQATVTRADYAVAAINTLAVVPFP